MSGSNIRDIGISHMTVTLDFWDTLVYRRCHPDAVKMEVAKYIANNFEHMLKEDKKNCRAIYDDRFMMEVHLSQQALEEGLDAEARILDVISNLLGVIFTSDFCDQKDDAAKKIVQHEISVEKNNTYINKDIINIVREMKPKEVGIISDFYGNSDFIKSILSHHDCALEISFIYTSADSMLTKRTGRLFQHVLESRAMSVDHWLHIGDNPHSDVSVPSSMGISAQQWHPQHEVARGRLDYSANLVSRQTALTDLIQTISRAKFHHSVEKQAAFEAVCPIFVATSRLIQEKTHGLEKVAFLTREGTVFQHILSSCNQLEIARPVVLNVSRLSTFAGSLKDWSYSSLYRFWRMYPSHSISALQKSLNMREDTFRNCAREMGIEYEEVLEKPWLDKRFHKFFHHPLIVSSVNDHLQYSRSIAREYISKAMRIQHGDTIGLFDVGWRGTIQDNIALILGDNPIKGFYVGITGYSPEPPSISSKQGLLFDHVKGQDSGISFSHLSPIEMLFNSSQGSVVEYRKGQKDLVEVICANHIEEDAVYFNFISEIQQVIVDHAAQLLDNAMFSGVDCEDIRRWGLAALQKYYKNPPYLFVEAFLSLVHNETFGNGGMVDYKRQLQEHMRNGQFDESFMSRFGWPGALRVWNELKVA